MIVGIVILRWIGPEKMGIWNTVLLFQPYISFLNLGIHVGLGQEFPFFLGRNDKITAQKLLNSALFVSIFAACIGSIAMSLYTIFLFLNKGIDFLQSGIFGIIIVSITFLQLFFTSIYRSNNDFSKLSDIYFIESIIILLGIPLVIWKGFLGFLIYQMIYRTSLLLLTILNKPYDAKPQFHKKEVLQLIKVGGPLYVFGYISALIKTIPKVIILSTGGVVILGLYAPVNTISNSLHLVSKYFAQFFTPKMAYKLGVDQNAKMSFYNYVKKSTIFIFILNIIMFIPAQYVLSKLIPVILPKYIDSIVAMKIILLSGLLSGALTGVSVLNVLKDFKGRLYITIINFTTILISIYVCLVLFDNILVSVASGAVIGDFLYNLISFVFIKQRHFRLTNNKHLYRNEI